MADVYEELEQKVSFLWDLLKPIRNQLLFDTIESIFKDCLDVNIKISLHGEEWNELKLSIHEDNNWRYPEYWSMILKDQ